MSAESLPLHRTGVRKFYVAIGVVIAGIAFVGFWPTYFGPLVAGNVDALALIHFHAAVYVGWLALFLLQAVLAAAGRVDLHLRVGRFGIAYGVLVIAAGLIVAFGMFAVRVRAGESEEAIRRLLGPLVDMLVFAPLFAAAVHYRKRPELHKRLMIVASTALLIAAVGRIRWLLPSLALIQLVWSLPILLAMAYDYAKRRIVHPVYVLGLGVLLLESPIVRSIARRSAPWRAFGDWLAGLVQ